jgi:23S rRNA maturation mini-RNase III
MSLFKKDPDVADDYSDINDVDVLVRKLADESCKIVKKHPFANFVGKLDELLEDEIHKFVKRVMELEKNEDPRNWFQKWF